MLHFNIIYWGTHAPFSDGLREMKSQYNFSVTESIHSAWIPRWHNFRASPPAVTAGEPQRLRSAPLRPKDGSGLWTGNWFHYWHILHPCLPHLLGLPRPWSEPRLSLLRSNPTASYIPNVTLYKYWKNEYCQVFYALSIERSIMSPSDWLGSSTQHCWCIGARHQLLHRFEWYKHFAFTHKLVHL